MKRVFRVHESAHNRYLYVLADMGTPFVEIMRTRLRQGNTPAFLEFVEQWKNKVNGARAEVEDDPILERRGTCSSTVHKETCLR